MKTASKVYAALVFLLLYAPIIVLIIFSFNSSSSTSVFSGFSLRWYESLFQDKATLRAFYNTIILAVTSSVIATVLGTKLRQTDKNLAEAAQDLGCRPAQAFFKVVLPSIMPGIITGMIMAFTLSLDDFIISYITCGPGFQPLPIAIFAMTKKRVKPDMYALSALIFVSILVLLILYNFAQQKSDEKTKSKK